MAATGQGLNKQLNLFLTFAKSNSSRSQLPSGRTGSWLPLSYPKCCACSGAYRTHFGEVEGKFSFGDCISQWRQNLKLAEIQMGLKNRHHPRDGGRMRINCRMGDSGLSPVGAEIMETVAGSMEKGYRNRCASPAGHPVASELSQRLSSAAFLGQKN